MTYVLAFLAAFASCFLKGLQFKNVQGNHYKLVFVTSLLIALADIAAVMLAIETGWALAAPWAIGGATAMVMSMKVHSRMVKK